MKKQKGMVPLAVLIIVAVVVFGAVGYFLSNKGKFSGGQISLPKIGGPALNANCELKDPDLCKYVNRSLSGDVYKRGLVIKSVTTDKSGKKYESVFEIDSKENSRIISYQNGKEISAIVNLNKATYMKDLTDGKWWKYENKTDQKSPSESEDKDQKQEDLKDQAKKIAEEIKNNITYKKIGKEACGSLSCFKYQLILSDMSDTVEYIYFDDQEYLMRKMRTESKDGTSSDITYEYKSVTIQEPSPIKEGNPWESMMKNNPSQKGSGISDEELKKIQEQLENQVQSQTEETQYQETNQ